jgi:hypothetical protein
MQDRQRARVVAVGIHIRVENDLHLSRDACGHTGEKDKGQLKQQPDWS